MIRYIADRMGDEEFVKLISKTFIQKLKNDKVQLELNLHLTEIKKEGIKTEIER